MSLQRAPQFMIRPMSAEDLLEVARIEADTFPSPWPYEALAFELHQNPFCATFCTESDGHVVAYAFLWVVYEQAHLINIAVAEPFRGFGIGEALLLHTMQYAARSGADLVHLEVREGNEAAVRLYLKHGFVVKGRKDHYYSDGSPALLMEAPLRREPEVG